MRFVYVLGLLVLGLLLTLGSTSAFAADPADQLDDGEYGLFCERTAADQVLAMYETDSSAANDLQNELTESGKCVATFVQGIVYANWYGESVDGEQGKMRVVGVSADPLGPPKAYMVWKVTTDSF